MLRSSLKWALPAVSLVLLVGLAVLPAAATQEGGGQEATAQEQELEARIKAQIEELLAGLEERMAKLQEEIEALHGNRLLLRELEGAHLEDMQVAQERMKEALEESMAARELHMQEALERVKEAQGEARWRALQAPRIAVGSFGPYAWAFSSSSYGEKILALAEELELSETQQQQIRDLQREFRRESISRKADVEVAEMDLEELRKADTPDLAAIRAQLEEIGSLKIDAEIAKLRLDQDVQQVLTAEQKAKIEEMKKKLEPKKISVAYSRR